MNTFFRKLRTYIAIALVSAATTLPACGTMSGGASGGGMSGGGGYLIDPPYQLVVL